MCLSRVLQPQWPSIWTNILVHSHKTGMTHFTHLVMHTHLSYRHSYNIIVTKKIPPPKMRNSHQVHQGKLSNTKNVCMFSSTVVMCIEREFIAHSQICLKALTLPSLLAATPFLHTTLQLACLKVADFRGQAHTNHRYALFCSAASTSCLGHTSLNPLPRVHCDCLMGLKTKLEKILSGNSIGVCCYHSEIPTWQNIRELKWVKSD